MKIFAKVYEIINDIELINKSLLIISVLFVFSNFNKIGYVEEFGYFGIIIPLIVPILFLMIVAVIDIINIITLKLNINKKKDFNILFNKSVYYFTIGITHIFINFNHIKDLKSEYQILFFIYVTMLVLSLMFILRYQFINKILSNINKLKNTKYLFICIVLLTQVFINSPYTQEKVKNYFERGYDPRYFKVVDIIPKNYK